MALESSTLPLPPVSISPIIPLDYRDFENVYEPAEDSFLFMDALEKDLHFLHSLNPKTVVEVGCGSGCITAFLALNLKTSARFIATDINPFALMASKKTFEANKVEVELVQTDLLCGLDKRLARGIDILLFNPPYVPTPPEEMQGSLIARSWAGGSRGREVTDRLLAIVDGVMSERGMLYMVALDSNEPDDIARIMRSHGFLTKVVKRRRAGIENLLILRLQRLPSAPRDPTAQPSPGSSPSVAIPHSESPGPGPRSP